MSRPPASLALNPLPGEAAALPQPAAGPGERPAPARLEPESPSRRPLRSTSAVTASAGPPAQGLGIDHGQDQGPVQPVRAGVVGDGGRVEPGPAARRGPEPEVLPRSQGGLDRRWPGGGAGRPGGADHRGIVGHGHALGETAGGGQRGLGGVERVAAEAAARGGGGDQGRAQGGDGGVDAGGGGLGLDQGGFGGLRGVGGLDAHHRQGRVGEAEQEGGEQGQTDGRAARRSGRAAAIG